MDLSRQNYALASKCYQSAAVTIYHKNITERHTKDPESYAAVSTLKKANKVKQAPPSYLAGQWQSRVADTGPPAT